MRNRYIVFGAEFYSIAGGGPYDIQGLYSTYRKAIDFAYEHIKDKSDYYVSVYDVSKDKILRELRVRELGSEIQKD